MIKCLYCDLPQAGNLQFIEGYCWNCLSKAQASSGLPIEVIAGLMKEGAVIKLRSLMRKLVRYLQEL